MRYTARWTVDRVEIKGVSQTRDKHVYGKLHKWSKNLRTFGETGVVKDGKDSKTEDRGIKMMFVGFPFNRETDSIRMWNPGTNQVNTS